MGSGHDIVRPAEPRSSRLVVAARVMALLLAGALSVCSFVLASRQEVGGFAARYTCPMHAQVTSTHPGECPICRMALEPTPSATSPATSLTPSRQQQRRNLVATAKRRLVSSEIKAVAWIEAADTLAALLHNDELLALSPDRRAVFFGSATPSASIEVRSRAEPPSPWDQSTSKVRFYFENAGAGPAPGDVGWVKLAASSRDLLAIPARALLHSPRGAYVLAASADGRTFSKRDVEYGSTFSGQVAILSGLRDDEPIAVGNVFLLDAQRKMQQGERAEAVPR